MSKMDVTGGEAFPFATLEGLMNKLHSPELLQFAEEAEIDTSLENWLEMLQFISDHLEDAVGRQLTELTVKSWLSKLRDLVYDADDIVDVLNTEMRKPSASDVVTGMSSEMKKITEGLDKLEKRIRKLDLKRPTEIKSNESIKEERITTSLLDHGILGREKDEEKILNLLSLNAETTSHQPPSSGAGITGMGGPKKPALPLRIKSAADSILHELLVIPIWGMGGIGKTTLAQLVYNNRRVEESFEPKVWVCVSDTFDVLGLTKTILKKVGVQGCDHDKDLSDLQEKLKEKLVRKKFMIVLDDVWSKNRNKWESFCKPLRAAGTASAIIVTCRNEDVASMMGTVRGNRLQGLSEENCLSLIVGKALKPNDFSTRPALEQIGKKIASRCQGSPLAAKTLGGLLANKSTPKDWEDVLQSKIWDLPENESRILPALRLSYQHLPSSLKQCFAYLAIFPKDYEFERDALVLLWMAEGFLEQRQDRLQMEDLGQQYFDDLVSRSLLQQSTNDPSGYVMHDLTHDLAEFVAGEICFRLEDGLPGNKTHKVFEKVRHSAYACQWKDIQKFDPLHGKKYLRTFLALSPRCGGSGTTVELFDNLSQFRWLRVLGLNHDRLDKLPDSVRDLKHLRYLDLSSTDIRCLPESISDLHNLQSLILDRCYKLTELPRGMTSLTNLRYLSLIDAENLRKMPRGLGSLKGLRNLTKFIVGKENGLGIQELEHLSHLRGGLAISGLENVVDVQQAKRAQLKEKQHLKELELEFTEDPHKANHPMLVLDSLQPHTSIQAVSISNYAGPEFPSWMGNRLFSEIVSLSLYNCGGCSLLPSLGRLLSLKNLKIEGLHEVRGVGIEFYGVKSSAFPSLETLTFEDMRNWEKWHGAGNGTFSRLRELSLCSCPMLVEVSTLSLPSLCELELEGCNGVVFRSLRDLNSVTSLRIMNISGLVCLGEGEQMVTLERLEMLNVIGCKELKCLWKKGGVHHPNESLAHHLRELVIGNCGVFECFGAEEKEDGRLVPCNSPLVQLSALADLCIESCNMFVNFGGMRFPSLTQFRMNDCYKWESLPELCCESDTCPLEQLEISNCPSFIRFPDGSIPKTIKQLLISKCEKLEALPDGIMNNNVGLEEFDTCPLECLEISECPSFIRFPDGVMPKTIKRLLISKCEKLEALPDGIMIDTCPLEHLEISECPSFIRFPDGAMPRTIKRLLIFKCEKLEALPDGIMNNNVGLEELKLDTCKSLRHFPQGELPISLKSLYIEDVGELDSISERNIIPNNICLEELHLENYRYLKALPECTLINLTSLKIWSCDGVESFWEGGFLAPKLKRLSLGWCNNLRCITDQIQSLTSLETLSILSCSALERFPEAGFPTSLLSLKIWNCQNVKQPISKWGLHKLTSLREFEIEGVCLDMVCFGDDSVLPSSLTSLVIKSFPKLVSLSSSLQNLISLRHLCLGSCPNLQSFPKELLALPSLREFEIEGEGSDMVCFGDDFVLPSSLTSLVIKSLANLAPLSSSIQNLISLRHLELLFCPKLQSLPKELLALLPQLSSLRIFFCPHLRRLFEKEKGEYWPHISLIPDIDLGLDYDDDDDDDVNDEDEDEEQDEDEKEEEEEEEEEEEDDDDDDGDGDGTL